MCSELQRLRAPVRDGNATERSCRSPAALGKRAGGPAPATALLVALCGASLLPAQGRVLVPPEQALRAAFPGCEIERAPVYLDAALRERVAGRAHTKDVPGIAFRWIARRAGRHAGSAWFDTHRVRTLRETLLLATDSEGKLRDIVVVAFAEPPDYLPRRGFYDQFRDRALADELDLGHGIDGVSGATLTVRATTRAARRTLALVAELRARGESAPALWPPELCDAASAARLHAEQLLQGRWPPGSPRPTSYVLDEARLRRWKEATDNTARDGIVSAFGRGDTTQPAAYVDSALDGGRAVSFLVLPDRTAAEPAADVLPLPGNPAPSPAAFARARRRCLALDRVLATPAETEK